MLTSIAVPGGRLPAQQAFDLQKRPRVGRAGFELATP